MLGRTHEEAQNVGARVESHPCQVQWGDESMLSRFEKVEGLDG